MSEAKISADIQALEKQLYELTTQLTELRKSTPGTLVDNYTFSTLDGDTSLLDLFGDNDKLLLIHNMGQGCRYCTLWADGFNGFVPHLESAMSVVLVSKDAPQLQRDFANSRGWRFRLASHGGGKYIQDQSLMAGEANVPGAILYDRKDDKIYRKNSGMFGPGDLYCSIWNLLGLAGLSPVDWTPQYRYWQRPQQMEDGGENVID